MNTGLYLMGNDGQLVELAQQAYDSEEILQTLLETYPNLLAGDQINRAHPRRWVLVARELGIPSEDGGTFRWALDHLFLDQEGVPTLVEVKRSSDTRIRREVVGQMLEYAANAVVYWPVAFLRETFEARCIAAGIDPLEVLATALGIEETPDVYWDRVKTNVEAGKMRLVFVADSIPPELVRIVEFLNGQMTPAEVLAIEIKQYATQNQRLLVPRVFGQTAAAEDVKGTVRIAGQRWTETVFIQALRAERPPDEVAAAERIYGWAKTHTNDVWWGSGRVDGSCYFGVTQGEVTTWPVALWTSGHVEIPLHRHEIRWLVHRKFSSCGVPSAPQADIRRECP
jgi:hypothetical protein